MELLDLGGKRNFKEDFLSAMRGCHGQLEFQPRGGNLGIPWSRGIPFQQQSPWKRENQGMQLENPIKKDKKGKIPEFELLWILKGWNCRKKTGRAFLG